MEIDHIYICVNDSETPVEELAVRMINNQIHDMIIMNDERIVGIVSAYDFLYHVAKKDKNI